MIKAAATLVMILACLTLAACSSETGQELSGVGLPMGGSGSSGNFMFGTDGVVKDSSSGLAWQRFVPTSYAPICSGRDFDMPGPKGEACNFEDAKKVCAGLSLNGKGWRLPTKAELEPLVKKDAGKPTIDSAAFPGTPTAYFWTSSPSSQYVWSVDLETGSWTASDVKNNYRVRCVR